MMADPKQVARGNERVRIGGGGVSLVCLLACGGGSEGSSEVEPAPTLIDCDASNGARPGSVLQVASVLATAIDGVGDPSQTYLRAMPNHQSGFWDTPWLGYERAKQELGTLGQWEFPPSKTEPIEDIIADQVRKLEAWTAAGVHSIALSAKSST